MIETVRLGNGLTVVFERLAHLKSAAAGVWVKAGSMLETSGENGLSHLMEHMAFKGTTKRSARELAELTDALGGHLNAATSKLCTSFYAKVTDADLPLAIDLLADLVMHPLMRREDLEKEKNVVLEEIAMAEDSPEDVADDLINEAMYSGQSLAMTVLGKKEEIAAYTSESLFRFYEKFYTPANTVVAVAGRFERQQLMDSLQSAFGPWRGENELTYTKNVPNETCLNLFRDKNGEQVHCFAGYAGISSDHEDIHAMMVLSGILGGGVSSRLFQRIREEQGLVYNIYTSPSYYPTCGDFMVYAASSPRNLRKVMGQIDEELEKLLCAGITEKELMYAKAQLKTGFVLAQESAYRRMTDLGLNMLIHRKVVTAAKTLRKIDRVSREDVDRLSNAVLTGRRSLAVVGKNPERYLRYFK